MRQATVYTTGVVVAGRYVREVQVAYHTNPEVIQKLLNKMKLIREARMTAAQMLAQSQTSIQWPPYISLYDLNDPECHIRWPDFMRRFVWVRLDRPIHHDDPVVLEARVVEI